MTTLRDGRTIEDRRLDRIPRHDPKSLQFPAREVIGRPPRRTVARFPARPTLDQGREGACVGFSIATGMNASPVRHRPALTDTFAREQIYYPAQREDQYEGGEYPGAVPYGQGGTDLIAGLKVAQRLGMVGTYRWCFGIDDVVDALIDGYGVLFGIPWYTSQYETLPSGVVEVDTSSGLAGYHAIWGLCFRYAVIPGHGPRKREHVVWQNTWGPGYGIEWYGVGGHGLVLVEDLADKLLPRAVWGEAAIVEQLAA